MTHTARRMMMMKLVQWHRKCKRKERPRRRSGDWKTCFGVIRPIARDSRKKRKTRDPLGSAISPDYCALQCASLIIIALLLLVNTLQCRLIALIRLEPVFTRILCKSPSILRTFRQVQRTVLHKTCSFEPVAKFRSSTLSADSEHYFRVCYVGRNFFHTMEQFTRKPISIASLMCIWPCGLRAVKNSKEARRDDVDGVHNRSPACPQLGSHWRPVDHYIDLWSVAQLKTLFA